MPKMAKNIRREYDLVFMANYREWLPKHERLNKSTALKYDLYVSCICGYAAVYLVL